MNVGLTRRAGQHRNFDVMASRAISNPMGPCAPERGDLAILLETATGENVRTGRHITHSPTFYCAIFCTQVEWCEMSMPLSCDQVRATYTAGSKDAPCIMQARVRMNLETRPINGDVLFVLFPFP